MEPKSSSPELSPSSPSLPPEQYRDSEPVIEAPRLSPEMSPEQSAEQPQSAPAQPALDPSQIALPTPVDPQAQTSSSASTDDTPQAAADDDLIEKEWVDKAKKIIAETRDDPHKQEKEVSRLQADYLRKRYGKELGAS